MKIKKTNNTKFYFKFNKNLNKLNQKTIWKMYKKKTLYQEEYF